MSNKKRYTATIDFYILAKSDQEAEFIVQAFCQSLRKEKDNQANLLELHETPFGTLAARKIK